MRAFELAIDFTSAPKLGGNAATRSVHSLPSDRLFSLISLGWIRLFGLNDYNSVLQKFIAGRPVFRHSDLFPFNNGSLWLPAPRWAQKPAESAKRRKRDKEHTAQAIETTSQTEASVELETLPEPNEAPTPTSAANAPRNQSGALAGAETLADENTLIRAEAFLAALFDSSQIRKNDVLHTDDRSSLRDATQYRGWLLADDDAVIEKLNACLEFMQADGFGAHRSTGSGTIKSVAIAPLDEQEKLTSTGRRKAAQHVILSACCPTAEFVEAVEATAPGSNNYSLSYTSGWIFDEQGRPTNIRKPITCAFETGSVFACKPEGRLVEVGTDEHPAYRYGFPFILSS